MWPAFRDAEPHGRGQGPCVGCRTTGEVAGLRDRRVTRSVVHVDREPRRADESDRVDQRPDNLKQRFRQPGEAEGRIDPVPHDAEARLNGWSLGGSVGPVAPFAFEPEPRVRRLAVGVAVRRKPVARHRTKRITARAASPESFVPRHHLPRVRTPRGSFSRAWRRPKRCPGPSVRGCLYLRGYTSKCQVVNAGLQAEDVQMLTRSCWAVCQQFVASGCCPYVSHAGTPERS